MVILKSAPSLRTSKMVSTSFLVLPGSKDAPSLIWQKRFGHVQNNPRLFLQGYSMTSRMSVFVALIAAALCMHVATASTLATLHRFTGGKDGALPVQSVTLDAAGNLYGETYSGGALCPKGATAGCGTVYKIDRSGKLTTLVTFDGNSNGAIGNGNLTISGDRIYGMAYRSGGPGPGLLFTVKTDGTGFKVVHRFTGSDGALPVETLRVAADGGLYGTTHEGGNPGASARNTGYGTLFHVAPDGTYTLLHQFTSGTDGGNPSRIVLGPDGTVYGGTDTGECPQGVQTCGVIYAYVPSTASFTVLHTFPIYEYGGKLGAIGPDGTLYGSAVFAGANGVGSLFALHPTGDGSFSYQTLYSFTSGADGAAPAEPPTLTASGALIGTSLPPFGQDAEITTLYSFANGEFTILYTFSSDTGGRAPSFALATPTVSSAGVIYGTTYSGGINPCNASGGGPIAITCGTVYAYRP